MSGILDHLSIGFGVAFSLTNILVAMIGSFIGTMVGVLPGLGPVNGVAMLIPIAFAMNLPPETALILLAAVYVGAEYGGRITAILLNVPGEASAIMTTLDGYPLARQGLATWPCRCRRGRRSSAPSCRWWASSCLRRCLPSGRWRLAPPSTSC